jgi:hypothetical protein
MKTYNAWFQPIKKTSCNCGAKHTQVVSWGEYSPRATFRTVEYICENCFPTRCLARLASYANSIGAKIKMNARSGYTLPNWLKLPYPIG